MPWGAAIQPGRKGLPAMIQLLKRLFSVGGGNNNSKKPVSLEALLSTSGRLKAAELQAFARSAGFGKFYATVTCPVLVGSSIRSGSLTPRGEAAMAKQPRKKTHLFRADQVAELVEGASLESSIFPVLHGTGTTNGDPTRFTIGRGLGNDIVMNDQAISEAHASISVLRGSYSIRDLNSTNGTKLNGAAIMQGSKPLKDGDAVTLGRYNFTFYTPQGLYSFLRQGK